MIREMVLYYYSNGFGDVKVWIAMIIGILFWGVVIVFLAIYLVGKSKHIDVLLVTPVITFFIPIIAVMYFFSSAAESNWLRTSGTSGAYGSSKPPGTAYMPLEAPKQENHSYGKGTYIDASGKYVGYTTEDGRHYNNRKYAGYTTEDGRHFNASGKYTGYTTEDGRMFDEHGKYKGYITKDGRFFDEHGKYKGYKQNN